jgi:cell wall-associated NlpC family hydrolase
MPIRVFRADRGNVTTARTQPCLRMIGTLALAAIASACASTGAVPRPFPIPGSQNAPPPEESQPGAPDSQGARASRRLAVRGFDGYAVAGTALSLRGIRYQNGGSDPRGFDCSGFTQYVYSQYGIALPRDVREQYRTGMSVPPEQLAPGDLVFFTTTDPDVSHVAIAIGGDEFVHAPSSTGVVRVEHLSGSYWAPRFIGIRRLN